MFAKKFKPQTTHFQNCFIAGGYRDKYLTAKSSKSHLFSFWNNSLNWLCFIIKRTTSCATFQNILFFKSGQTGGKY